MATTAKDRAGKGMGRMEQSTSFDTWLQTRLQRLYDGALAEPLPDDLLELLPGTTSD